MSSRPMGYKLASCECTDPGCPHCQGHCRALATETLYRVDQSDKTGTDFCQECGADAFSSGVFADGGDHA